MRRHVSFGFAAAVLLVLTGATARAEDREVWRSDKGSFEHVKGKEWIETYEKATFHYVELARDEKFIELFDKGRNFSVRLFDGYYEVKVKGKFERRLNGKWSAPMAAKPDGVVQKELKALEGTWERKQALRDGKPFSDPTTTGRLTVKFAGKEYRILLDGNELRTGTFTIDLSKSPRMMDLYVEEDTKPNSDFKGKTFLYVYEFKDGQLKMAGPPSDTPDQRPKDMEGKVGFLSTFEKVK